MSRTNCDDSVGEYFTKDRIVQLKATIVENKANRAAVRFPPSCKFRYNGPYSYIQKVGEKNVSKTNSVKQVAEWIQQAEPTTKLLIIHSTKDCVHCGRPAWQLLHFEREGHSTCPGCGTVVRLCQNKFSLRLTDDGEANKSQWEHTPGMTHRDTELLNKKGKRLEIAGQKPASHLRNYWRIRKKIDGIAQFWVFLAIESIIRRGKAVLKQFYYSIHRDDDIYSDNSYKLPHGGAALAASCFYVAVLEFENRVRFKTPCTLSAIQEQAQQERDVKHGRRCRDVTDRIILKYAHRLKKCGFTSATIPQLGSQTLHFHPKSAGLEHSRMAIFNECHPVRFHLPMGEIWGIKIGDTHQGVLYIDNCNIDGNGWKQGLRKGDYIFQIERETIDIKYTPSIFEQHILKLKKKYAHKPVIEFMIMRKNKK